MQRNEQQEQEPDRISSWIARAICAIFFAFWIAQRYRTEVIPDPAEEIAKLRVLLDRFAEEKAEWARLREALHNRAGGMAGGTG